MQEIDYRIDITRLEREQDAENLGLNEIGRVRFRTANPLMYDVYRANRAAGSFIVIDESTNATVGAGMIRGTEREVPGHEDDAEYVI